MSRRLPVVYDAATGTIDVTDEINDAANVPTPYRPTGLAAIFEPERTLEDDAEWYRQYANKQRARAVAVEASIALARTIHKVSRLPHIFAQDDQIADARFANQMAVEEVMALRCQAEKAELTDRIAKCRASAARHDLERTSSESNAKARTRGAREFEEELEAKREMRRARDQAIADIRRSNLSAAEKTAQIAEIQKLYTTRELEE